MRPLLVALLVSGCPAVPDLPPVEPNVSVEVSSAVVTPGIPVVLDWVLMAPPHAVLSVRVRHESGSEEQSATLALGRVPAAKLQQTLTFERGGTYVIDAELEGRTFPGLATVRVDVPVMKVTVGGATFGLDGVNVLRAANAMVIYTASGSGYLPLNAFGTEVAVRQGRVAAVAARQNDGTLSPLPLPPDGYLLTGHGSAGQWLVANAAVGAQVVVEGVVLP